MPLGRAWRLAVLSNHAGTEASPLAMYVRLGELHCIDPLLLRVSRTLKAVSSARRKLRHREMATLIAGSSQLMRAHGLSSLNGQCSNCAARHVTSLIANSSKRTRKPPSSARHFSSSNSGKRPKFSQRLGEALRNSKIQWYQIPVGLGIGFLGLVQFYKVSAREKKQRELEEVQEDGPKPAKRARIRPDGPW